MVSLDFAINHMAAPQLRLAELFALAAKLGAPRVEIRNDISGNAMLDGTPAQTVRELADEHDVTIISINALQQFNVWSDARAEEAKTLAAYCSGSGAKALVLVAENSGNVPDSSATRIANATQALTALSPIMRHYGIIGLVECLGFKTCSLRSKREALVAIDAANGRDVFRLTHDTFHHHLAGEPELFPELTGLVHISGVDERDLAVADMRDSHRLLVGSKDRLDNLGQIVALRRGGYCGPLSFEPFAEELRHLADPAAALQQSMQFITEGLRARAA
ncbi:TIM barrel protein [Devosia psychrophila]|uniref:Xylose isomerase n=1 Tax=Devosia psychrophila TaxID=728005 RepID=A0ABR5DTC6_9HYPH|nr:TIM barrel protein [Devosia psychrophila]KKC31263.1 xylose isomerase [Devosia psychrophila]